MSALTAMTHASLAAKTCNHAPSGADRGTRPVRVMIVDDSLTVRAILKRMVESDLALTVTGTASSAENALKMLQDKPADVVLLDLEMPGMGGLDALPAILGLAPHIRVLVVSALTEQGAQATLAALAMGAADTMWKPQPGEFTEDYRTALLARICALGLPMADPRTGSKDSPQPALSARNAPTAAASGAPVRLTRPDVLAIGASTGGIHALGLLLGRITSAFAAPILITQHLPASFMAVFARQIESSCGRPTTVAQNGLVLEAGRIIIASGEGHLCVRPIGETLSVQISHEPAPNGCRPSVDPMLASLAETCGNRALAIILSGMGSDGLAGAQRLVAAGGTILAQDAASSAVWGMPGVVTRAGLAQMVAPPEQLGDAVMASASALSRR